MNDTKWREVLVIAARLELWFVATFIDADQPVVPAEFDHAHLRAPLPKNALGLRQIGDWGGMSGPYKNILWILFPRRFCYTNDGGHKRYRDQRIQDFLDQSAGLGQLPLEVTEHFVRVHGYKLATG